MPKKKPDSKIQIEKGKTRPAESSDLIALWSLRVLVRLRKFERFVGVMGGFNDEELLQSIGLQELYSHNTTDKRKILAIFNKRLKELETLPVGVVSDVFSHNIAQLEQALSLSVADKEILRFAIVSASSQGFSYILDILGELTHEQMKRTIACILDIPLAQIEKSFRQDGKLLSSGLLRIETSGAYLHTLQGRLEVPQGIRYALSQEHGEDSGSAILQCFFRKTRQARLGLEDFPHLRADIELMQTYLKSAGEQQTRGVNILIYGEPGTGKTELVYTLAATTNTQLYDITMEDGEGLSIDGRDRFSALLLSQKLLAHKKHSAIIFDEIEDAFPNTDNLSFGNAHSGNLKKAWVNSLLENNLVPTFWVSNIVYHIDPSFLRRFDYCLRLRPPSHTVRYRILEKYLGHLPVTKTWLTQMAEHERLVPAHIERAAKVVSHLAYTDSEKVERTLERVLGNTLEVLGLPRKPRTQTRLTTPYRLDILNADYDLQKLTEGIMLRPQVRICLYGAPGTGKSAFGQYLAKQIDKPLLLKRASDILSKWVGEAEKNIAAMFQEAEAEDMVLLLDEADSFLRDRAGSQHSWEVTQVNELLVQMESFEGVFIAATNLMDSLDEASLRRFDLKIKLDFLKPQQAWDFFGYVLKEAGVSSTQTRNKYKRRIQQLHNLTPGDFTTIIRQARSLNQALDAAYLVEALESECRNKPGSFKFMGFTADH